MRNYLVLFVFLFSAVGLAHTDDPKSRMQPPAYRGPGFRADLNQRLVGTEFPSSNVELLSWLPLTELDPDADYANDCWGYTSPNGNEYAIIGTFRSTVFVDVTNPGNARIIARFDSPISLWRDVKVYEQFAYVVSEGGGGIQVFDMTNIDNDTIVEANSAFDSGTDATHNVAIDTDSGFLYRCGGSGNGLRIFSLADPANPQFVAQWNTRYTHDMQAVTYQEGTYAGRQIAFSCGGFNNGYVNSGVTILDVTDKNNIQELAHFTYPNNVYAHQGWLSEDKQRFYLNDELDEDRFEYSTLTRVVNVADLENPFLEGTISTNLPAIDHNLYIKGDLMLQANYLSGLRVFLLEKDSSAACEVAFFDTYPENDDLAFSGLWSNYPYFESGTIIGSDMQRGLFVWRLGDIPAGETILPTNLTEYLTWAASWLGGPELCNQRDLNEDQRRDVRDLIIALETVRR